MPIRKGTFEFQISDYRADQAWILFFMSVIKHLQRKQVYLLSWQHSCHMSHAQTYANNLRINQILSQSADD